MVSPNGKFFVTATLAALMLAIGYDSIRLMQEQRFNHALVSGDAVSIDGPGGALRQFAKAFDLQQAGDFRNAVQAYAAIDTRPDSRLQMDIKFNLANLYFQEALKLGETGANDLAMPLVELAKQNYKEILRIDNGNWDAKYNLELALVRSPDTEPVDALEERNPEHSPRALTKIKSREPLP